MAEFAITDMHTALEQKQFPTVTLWNRLEARPVKTNFDRALRVEVRDALWFLTRQWQIGEFKGDDAGTPALAKLHLSTTRLTKYQANENSTESFDNTVPLEAKVERRPLRFTEQGKPVSLDLRLLMGRYWTKLVKPIGNYESEFIRAYGIDLPDPSSKDDALYCAHRDVWSTVGAVAGRRMDGAKLYFYLVNGSSHHAYDGIPVVDGDKTLIDSAAKKFMKWFESLFFQPPAGHDDAWKADRLEYQFATSAPDTDREKVYKAQEYYQGQLDWYNFDLDVTKSALAETAPASSEARGSVTQTLIPVPVSFPGMPNARWWTFEDGKTNFGDVKPETTDVGKLLLIDFGLLYANDWSIVPFTLPMGSIARVEGLAVTNVFGERTWIDAAGSGEDDDWQRWRMFTVSDASQMNVPADTSLLLLPTTPKIQESKPLEEVVLARDEMANMVWALEKRIPLATGDSKSGSEAAAELRSHHQRILDRQLSTAPASETVIEYKANIRYELMNTVPENWIPFISVHVDGDTRQMQLQRAAMPRILEGDTSQSERVQPRTMLMREGLDRSPSRRYFLHEEEVPRAGVRLTQAFQRTRWLNGKVFVWLGVRKQTGRGEGSSGLAFDRVVDAKSRMGT